VAPSLDLWQVGAVRTDHRAGVYRFIVRAHIIIDLTDLVGRPSFARARAPAHMPPPPRGQAGIHNCVD
jgi:hypothetical protein